MTTDKKHILFSSTILALGIAIAGVFVGWGFRSGFWKPQKVTVKGFAERPVEATQASWKIEFESFGNTQALATQQALEERDKAQAILTELGLTENEIKPQASRIQRYTYNTKDTFSVNQSIWITSQNVRKVEKVFASSDKFLEAGIALKSWESPNYSFDQLEDIKPAMIAQATKVARESAQQFAKDSDSDVGKILSANQGYFSYRGQIEGIPQTNQIEKIARVVVTIEYQLK